MIRKFKLFLALAATVVLQLQQADAQIKPRCRPVTIDISTGVDASGNILPVGVTDPKWQNTAGMGDVVATYPGWSTQSGSAWLGSSTGASNTNYIYTLNFSNPTPGSIDFTALADNYVTIELDGTPIAQTPGLSIYGFQTPNAATYSGSVGAGAHTLTATVYNQSGPTGFNLNGSVTYAQVPVTQDLSTGVNGVILPVGATDPNWSGPLNTVATMVSWDNFSGSAWIGNGTYKPAAGTYTYTRIFTISGGGTLNIEAMADNYVEMYLDGSLITQTPGLTPYGFKLANLAAYTGSITGGTHTLTANVYNQGGPVGLNVHASVTYCGNPPAKECTADPSFSGSYAGGLSATFIPNNVPQPGTIVTHYWDFGDGTTSSATSPYHTYPAAGSYLLTHIIAVQILDEKGNVIDGCKDKKECKLVISDKSDTKEGAFRLYCDRFAAEKKGTLTADLPELFSISPNPATNEINIRGNKEPYQLQIVSIDGKTVMNTATYNGTENTINISGLSYGTYIVIINQGGTMKHFRFVKMQ